MTTYPVGAAAEKVIGITIDRAGVFSFVQRQRTTGNRLVDLPSSTSVPTRNGGPAKFVVRVARDHSGFLEIAPENIRRRNACTIIPLGLNRPFLDSELPPAPGSNGAYSRGSEMHFRFSDATLTWASFNLSGRIELSERVPVVSVLLRLPAGHDGELTFSNSSPS